MNKIFRNAVLAYVVTSMASLPFVANLAYADVVASSSSGTVFGHSLETGVPVDFNESTGQVSSQGQNIIVFPQKSGAMGNVRSTYGNIPALQGAVAAQAGALENENSDQGNAYRTLKSGIHVPRPDLRNDIMITNTEAILKDTAMNNGMSQCYTTVRESQVPGQEVTLEDFKSCDRFIRPQGCQVTRQVHKAQPVTFIQGPGSGRQISLSQYEITMGVEGNDNLSGSPCKVHTQNMRLRVNSPDQISRAVINHLAWDDHIQLKIGSTVVASKPGSVFPEGGATCPSANAGGSEQTAIDITPYLTNLYPGQSIEIELKVATVGSGEGYAKAIIEMSEPEQQILQEPDGCLDEILSDPDLLGEGDHTWTPGGSVNNQASTDLWECLQASNALPITLDGGTPYTITPDDSDFLGPLYPGEPGKPAPMCFAAKLRSLGKLDACHESPLEEGDIDNGKPKQCQTIDWAEIEGEFSNCQPLQSNPDCRYKESECVEYRGGKCSHYEDVYDCGTKVDLGETITNETLICPGSISCMGAECTVDRFGERNKDLSSIVPYLEIMKNSPSDAECDQTGKGCKFFGGKPFTCKVVFGGIQDCCDQPTPGVSVVDYMKLAMASYELAKETQLFDDLVKQGAGLWRDVSTPVKSLYDQISKPMISAFDNLVASSTAGAGAAATAAEGAAAVTKAADAADEGLGSVGLGSIKKMATTQLVNWAENIFGEGILTGPGGLFVKEGAFWTLNVSGNMAAAFIHYISLAYTIYTIIVILIKLLWPCTDAEFQLAVKKKQRLCHKVGKKSKKKFGITISVTHKYCCFNSPFARIIHQQTRNGSQPSLYKPWGGYKRADCTGFTQEQFDVIDFAKVDLSEWIALLKLAGIPVADSAAKLVDSATAGSRILPGGKTTSVAIDRAKALIDGQTGGSPDALDDRREVLQEKTRTEALSK